MDEMLVWFSEDLVANLLGFYQLMKHFRMFCDTDVVDAMFVNYAPEKWMKFDPFGAGLNVFDIHDKSNTKRLSFYLATSCKP